MIKRKDLVNLARDLEAQFGIDTAYQFAFCEEVLEECLADQLLYMDEDAITVIRHLPATRAWWYQHWICVDRSLLHKLQSAAGRSVDASEAVKFYEQYHRMNLGHTRLPMSIINGYNRTMMRLRKVLNDNQINAIL